MNVIARLFCFLSGGVMYAKDGRMYYWMPEFRRFIRGPMYPGFAEDHGGAS